MNKAALRKIGRYRVVDVIGQGGMGVVYRAVDETIDRQVAIKMLLGGGAEDEELLARFHREVRSTANLQHKNIVTVFALDDFEGFPYMVMEYLEGQSIAQMISSRRQLDVVEKLRLLGQVCEGLQYAHQRNIIHRDIKPANILVLKDGTAKIVDFGIARVGKNETRTLTQAGQIIGSIYYMSPEQLTPPSTVDARTDVYSTGVTLYQFITGELPFKSPDNDPQETIVKILNDPVPLLGKYLTNVPADLDELLCTAMAKDPGARYQSAEDFGYELSRMEENLRHEMISEFLLQAKQAIAQQNFNDARQKLQEIQRFDKRNPEANELFQLVREQLQRQQRSVQVAHLQSQAQIALEGTQYEEAFECIEQARRLDPENKELAAFSIAIKTQIERARELAEALRRGQAALYAGDLDEAGAAVQKALQIDNTHTEARALEGLIRKELEDRSRRSRLHNFVERARRDISDRNYLSALQALKEAQSIDPADSNIQELLNWAQRGHEQEKLRNELHRHIDEVGQHIGQNRYSEALLICESALQRFPNDSSLLKLQQLAYRQKESADHRRTIEEACTTARSLIDEDKSSEAVNVLEDGLRRFPGEPLLAALLANTRAENERKIREKEERERHLRILAAQSSARESERPVKTETLSFLTALQAGMNRNVSMTQLISLAEQLRNASADEVAAGKQGAQISALLSEFDLRLTKWRKDIREIEDISNSIQNAKDLAAVNSLDERARFLRDLHGQDEEILSRFEKIQKTADQLREDHGRVSSKCLVFLQSIHGNQDLEELLYREKQMREDCARWMEDDAIRSIVNQASAYVDENRQRKMQALDELTKLKSALASVRSAGQTRLLEQQAQMLAADFADADVDRSLEQLTSTAQEKILQIEQALQELKGLASKVDQASSIEEIERSQLLVEDRLGKDSGFEEVIHALKRIQRQCEERRREYGRIRENLTRLVVSAEKAADQPELDLIQARERDLLKRYAGDSGLRDLETRLELAVRLRSQALDQAASVETEGGNEEAFESADVGGPRHTQSAASKGGITALGTGPRVVRKRPFVLAFLVGGIVIVISIGLGWWFLSRAESASLSIHTRPGAQVLVDNNPAGTADRNGTLNLSLKPGTHAVQVNLNDYESFREAVPIRSRDHLIVAAPLPPRVAAPQSAIVGTLSVIGNVDSVDVFVDDQFKGTTKNDRTLSLELTAGLHSVRFEKQGYKNLNQSVDIGPQSSRLVSFVLSRSASEQENQSQFAFVTVRSLRGASVYVDSTPRGLVNDSGEFPFQLVPGKHSIQVSLNDYQTYQGELVVKSGERQSFIAQLTPLPEHPPPLVKPSLPLVVFSVNETTIEQGQSTKLEWQTQGATTVSIDSGIGEVELSGQREIRPATNVTFTLTATGPGGSQTKSLAIHVSPNQSPTSPAQTAQTNRQQHQEQQLTKTGNETASAELSNEDKIQIQKVADLWAQGFNQKQITLLKTAYPQIPTGTVNQLKAFFRNANHINMQIGYVRASSVPNGWLVAFTQSFKYDLEGKTVDKTDSVTWIMVKLPDGWKIASILISGDAER